jgi:hypothetical protein
MSRFGRSIRPHVDAELRAAAEAESRGLAREAFAHLERAHVLGQASTAQHVRVHWRMLLWGLRRRDARECLGQVLRIGGAATKTAIGWVPDGNTGGSNVSPFRRMPVPPELQAQIRAARGSRDGGA